ncbi:MAG: glycerophosphodiester phosphodiesterase family protein [Allobranchiibius sp.]
MSSLIRLRAELGSDLPLTFLLEDDPLQLASTTGPSSYDDLLSPTGLRRLSGWADAAGLSVHVWTFRAENAFLPEDLRRPGQEADHGDVVAEMRRFLRVGVDALICDQPDLAVLARDEVMAHSTGAYGRR